ncbi:putative Peptidase M50 [Thiomonas arsenitoxydans]|uniref:Peptidase M50 n=1 Tax=Thiomonas arsenitoxydans (strain DSM 22701 / CIP 110005 / 3As) TaxID=426114 RepID=D6CQ36_THIA3|nr:M50 family metallopeptidase [Thiomonas arsenitoxydans]CAZ88116.1 putative Peptidase M50 [Thiomonas arsenitoxydans]CQR32361.1 putative Peptidase M50 [Thiomonas arsenitoxydans]CQR32710.1 putative Peptidase M50 [Thiomonas arsenitoxydans]CQR34263.1 putative Peptidase M50 [Thiomonas arsenitoxydans]CQR40543.1 putative Peptidase M50 [Thiomonas arsenitoxydans]
MPLPLALLILLAAVWLVFTSSFLAHELGHAWAARWLGYRPGDIEIGFGPGLKLRNVTFRLIPLQASVQTLGDPSGWRVSAIALAGPAASMLLGSILLLLGADPGPLHGLLQAVAGLNISIGLFNLLPLPPLDGWRALEPFVYFRLGKPNQRQQIFMHKAGFAFLGMTGIIYLALRGIG